MYAKAPIHAHREILTEGGNGVQWWRVNRGGGTKIGFNQARTEAVVVTELYSGPPGGVYDTVLLRKRAGQWTIVEQNESQWIV